MLQSVAVRSEGSRQGNGRNRFDPDPSQGGCRTYKKFTESELNGETQNRPYLHRLRRKKPTTAPPRIALREVIQEQRRPWEVEAVSMQDLLESIDFFRKSTGIPFQEIYNIMLRRGWTLGAAQLTDSADALDHPAVARRAGASIGAALGPLAAGSFCLVGPALQSCDEAGAGPCAPGGPFRNRADRHRRLSAATLWITEDQDQFGNLRIGARRPSSPRAWHSSAPRASDVGHDPEPEIL